MGVTNLKVGLERKYSIWLGEKKQIDKEIKEILGAYTKLAEKQIRAERLDRPNRKDSALFKTPVQPFVSKQ